MTNNKFEQFNTEQQEIAKIAKVLSHPARIAIIQILAEKKEIKTGNISDFLPISRTTVSQHLKELKETELMHSTVDSLKVNYCLCNSNIEKYLLMLESFFEPIRTQDINCDADHKHESNLTKKSSKTKNY